MVDQDELALGGAACELRLKGYRWQQIAEALGTPFPGRVRQAALVYLLWTEAQEQGAKADEPSAGHTLVTLDGKIPKKQPPQLRKRTRQYQ